MMTDKISIIVPVYNAQFFLKECILSVLKQSYSNWELLLIDDASTDDSVNICKKYLSDSRIKLICLDHCGLPGVVRNTGIKRATGEYILFLDADDYLEHTALESLYKAYDNVNIDFSICNFRKINCGKIEKRNDNFFIQSDILDKTTIFSYAMKVLEQQNKNVLFNYCWGRLYKTIIIKDNNLFFNEELYTFEDIEFNFRYLKYVNFIAYLNEVLYNYRIHESTIFNTNIDKFFNYIKALQLMKPFYSSFLKERNLNKKIGNMIISLTILQLVRSGVIIKNKKKILNFYHRLVNDKRVRENLKFYSPKKGESILVPLLIFLKLKHFLFFTIKYKANKRYNKK